MLLFLFSRIIKVSNYIGNFFVEMVTIVMFVILKWVIPSQNIYGMATTMMSFGLMQSSRTLDKLYRKRIGKHKNDPH